MTHNTVTNIHTIVYMGILLGTCREAPVLNWHVGPPLKCWLISRALIWYPCIQCMHESGVPYNNIINYLYTAFSASLYNNTM